MKKILLSIYCFFTLLSLGAQKMEQGFDYAFRPTERAARYFVVTEKKDSLWHRQAWYIPEKSMAMEGWYKDSVAKVPHGTEQWYHISRYLKSTGSYKDGKKEGVWLTYDEEGQMKDSAFYSGGKLKGVRLKWNADGYQTDSMNFDGNGNGVQVSWYNDGQVSAAGRWVSDTSKQGRWQYFHTNGKLKATEDYVNGKRTACLCYDEAGTQLDPKDCEGREAGFPGGVESWKRFVQNNLKASVPARLGAPLGSYTVVMQFIVDTDGKLSDIKPRTQFGYGMEAEVERMLKQSPRWVPAMQFGRKVKAYRLQPVTFVVSN